MTDLLQTGVDLFDKSLGGLLPGRPYFAFGGDGTGKTLLGLQFLCAGIERGEPGLLLTLERPDDLLPQGERMGFHLEAAVDDGRLVLLEYDRNATDNILRFGWKPFLDQIRLVGEGSGIRRAVFDPVHPLVAGNIEEGRLRYDMRYFVENLEEWGWTTLFLNERGATQGHPSFYRVFADLCSGVFELQDEAEELTVDKFLFVHKLRHATGPRRKIPFQIVNGKGLVEAETPSAGHVAPAPSGPMVAAPDPCAKQDPQGRPTILIADDDPFIRRILSRKLEVEFRVIFAEDGVDALTMTLTEHPAVLVLDVVLPKIDGFEVCRSLRDGGHQLPILFVSGGAVDDNDRMRGLLLGANDYIAKPFMVQEVVEKIRNASRYRVDGAGHCPPERDVETLIRSARARRLRPEAFRERLSEAWTQADRYGTGLGLIRVRWDADANGENPAEPLGDLLERMLPSADSMARWAGNEWVLLRNICDPGEVASFTDRICKEAALSGGVHSAVRDAGVRISFGHYQPSGNTHPDLDSVIAGATWGERSLACFAETDESGEAEFRTGTDWA